MGATEKVRGVEYSADELLAMRDEARRVVELIGDSGRLTLLPEFKRAWEAYRDRIAFDVNVHPPKTFAQFLALQMPTEGQFNQLASEVPFWMLLDQIEEVVHGPDAIKGTGQSFFVDLWANEVANTRNDTTPLGSPGRIVGKVSITISPQTPPKMLKYDFK